MAIKNKNNDSSVDFSKIAGTVRVSSVKDFIKANYKPYIDYSILDRALVREDGLKPVQRRGLWALWQMGLKHNGGTKKANTVYGKTIGDYHPHGPSSVSGAISKLGQWYTSRVPLIEVQGNVGTETGDKPSADRYYEIKLSRAAELLIEDVKNHAAKMIPNYSNEKGKEIPEQFPAKWPYSIVNGGQGIAVGYATNMVPHNPTEVMNAVIERIRGNVNTTKKLISIMKGPDLPTGGELIGIDGVKDYYETGKGSFVIRGTYEIEALPRGRHAIIFNSLPYQVSQESIQVQIKKAQSNKNKLKDITEVKNLTDMDTGVRFVVYVKAGANPQLVVEELFKETSLQAKFSVNNTIVLDGKPIQATMFELLDQFISHKRECFLNKTEYRLEAIGVELLKNQGLIKVLVDIDKAISIIRKSDNAEVAKEKLMKHFKIDGVAADYVLSMQLQRLTKQDKISLENKVKSLEEEKDRIKEILSREENISKAIIEELQEAKKIIGDNRLTKITDISNEDLENEEKEARKNQRLLGKDVECKIVTFANGTVAKVIGESKNTLPILSEISATSQGKVNALMIDGTFSEVEVESILLDTETSYSSLGLKENKTVKLLPTELKENEKILVVTSLGNVAIYKSINKSPLVKVLPGETIRFASIITEEDLNKDLVILARDGMCARFKIDKIREVNGGSGTIAGMKASTIVVGATILKEFDYIVSIGDKSIKVTEDIEVSSTNRGVKGSVLHKLGKGDNLISIYASSSPKAYNKDLKEISLPKPTPRAGKTFPLKEKIVII